MQRSSGLGLFVACLAVACSFNNVDGTGMSDDSGSDSGDSGSGTDGGEVGDGIEPDGPDGEGTGSGDDMPDSGDADTGGTDATGDTGDDTGTGQSGLCPDPLPSGWIICEDFEDVGNTPLDHFASFQSETDRLAIEEGPSVSGTTALRIRHDAMGPNNEWSGALSFRFGAGPPADGVIAMPDETFDDVWVRAHLRTDDDWPGHGHDDLFELEARREDPLAMDFLTQARARSPLMADQLITRASTCIAMDGSDLCESGPAATLGEQVGEAPIFSAEDAGQWHCLELHMRLNASGDEDGVIESFVDGESQGVLDDLDLRADRDDVTINYVRFATYWNGGPPQTLERWVDDIVISTERPGCNEP